MFWRRTVAHFVLLCLVVVSGRTQVVLNEFMAANDTTVADEAGQFEDWVELYNAGAAAVNLKGWHLTDDFSKLRKWTFPDTSLPPGGFLLIWCDNDPGDGPLHATFKLDADGEELALVDPQANVVDSLTFGRQKKDVSYGRVPDGGPTWMRLNQPTPGASNVVSSVRSWPGVGALSRTPNSLEVWPNPVPRVGSTLNLWLRGSDSPSQVVFEVVDLLGRQVAAGHLQLVRGRMRLALGAILKNRPAGTYLLRVRAGSRAATAKVTVLP